MNTIDQNQQKEDKFKNSTLYRAIIGVCVLVFLLIARWAMVNVSNRMRQMREAFWPFLRKALIITAILSALFTIVIVIINYQGKKKERDDHFQ